MKKLIICTLLAILFVFFPSCSDSKAESKVIHVAYSQDIPTLDVMRSNNRALRDMLVGHVYERLFVLDEEGNVQDELASSHTLGNDNHTLEVELRKDVLFHDGSKLRAEDAAASLNRWIESYKDAERMTGDGRFVPVDDLTIRIESDNSLLFFPYLLASSPFAAVIMPESIATSDDSFLHDVTGTGPYMVDTYLSGDKLILEKFEDYVPNENGRDGISGEKHGYADEIVYHIVPDAVSRRIGLERGEYDHINDVMSQDIPLFEKNDDVVIYGGEESGSIALVFNSRTTDKVMREAIEYAISPDSLMKACYGDYGYSLHKDYMEKGSPFSLMTPSTKPDLDRARTLIADNDLEGREVRIMTSNLSNLDKIGVELSEELARAGFRPILSVYDWAGFIDKRMEGNFDIMISAFSTVPLPTMKVFLSSTYPGWYESEKSEEYLSAVSNAATFDDAVEVWKEAQEFYHEDRPVIVPGHYISLHAGSADISGVIYTDGAHFWNARKSEWQEE